MPWCVVMCDCVNVWVAVTVSSDRVAYGAVVCAIVRHCAYDAALCGGNAWHCDL